MRETIPELLQLTPKEIAPGETLMRVGDTDCTAYFITKGAFEVSWNMEGRREVFYRCVGDWVGEIALILKSPRTATVTAMEPSEVLSIDDVLLSSFSEISQLKIYKELSKLAAEHIRQFNEIIAEAYSQINSDLNAAAGFLESLLPAPIEEGNVKTDWRFVPCTRLGGDLFGYGWLSDELFSVYLLDVCGHGTKAALFSSSVWNVLRAKGVREIDLSSPAQVLNGLNESFPLGPSDYMFFTIWYGVYDLNTRQLRYSSAGHPPALLGGNRAGVFGISEQLKTTGPLIGFSADFTYETHTVEVPPGGRLILYSDGVYEFKSKKGVVGTHAGFMKKMHRYLNSSVFSLDWVYKHITKMVGTPQLDDDFTILQIDFR